MDPQRWDRIQALFHDTAKLPFSEQNPFLESACGDDRDLIASVLAMLDEDRRGADLIGQELPDLAAGLLNHAAAPTEIGPYKIMRMLGEGGMGVVYLGVREDVHLVAAIKLLRDALLSPARTERFTIESTMLARFQHPSIARIYDAGTLVDGTPWFAMEYVDGITITEYCRARASSIPARLRIFRALCEAVQYAHAHAVIHRDLKPSNVLVTSDRSVKLLDFGIAKQIENREGIAEQTQTFLRPMTIAYASPEQIRGEPLGIQSDVYSLGVMLFELLADRLPFDLSNLTQSEAERAILEQQPAPPSSAQRRSPAGKRAWADLDVLCLTAMRRDTARRYRSVEALTRDIDHYLNGEPLDAQPDSLSYRLTKFTGRHWRAISLTAAISALIVGLVAFFVIRLDRARNTAVAEAVRTQRIERFMFTLFDGGDKSAGPSDDLRAITLLDRGVKNAQALNQEPAVQAELYQTLGTIYEKLGKYDRADPLLESSLERHKTLAGSDSPEVANDLVQLGMLRFAESKMTEAERLIREGLAMDRRHLPPGDPAIAKAMSALGHVLEERNSYDEAVGTLEEAARIQSAKHDPSTELSDTLNLLAIAHHYLGHLNQAESLYKQALAIDRQLYGDVHPRVADDYFDIGYLQHDLGREADSERYYREALRLNQAWYGDGHPDTATMLAGLGQSLVNQHRYDEAAPLLEQALAIQERLFGKVHAQVAITLSQLGVMELRRGHVSEAEKYFLRGADINRAVYGNRHYQLAASYMNLGEVYVEQKDLIRAERTLRLALDTFPENLPPDHPTIAIARARLGHVFLLKRQYKEAEREIRAAYQVFIKQGPAFAKRFQDARTDLVAVYEALKQPDRAAAVRGQQPTNPPTPTQAP